MTRKEFARLFIKVVQGAPWDQWANVIDGVCAKKHNSDLEVLLFGLPHTYNLRRLSRAAGIVCRILDSKGRLPINLPSGEYRLYQYASQAMENDPENPILRGQWVVQKKNSRGHWRFFDGPWDHHNLALIYFSQMREAV